MRTPAMLRRRARRGLDFASAGGLAILVHAGLLLLVVAPITEGFMGMTRDAEQAPAAAAVQPPAPPMEPSCVADALLAAGAGQVWCQSPLADGTCGSDVAARYDEDVARCHGKEDRPVAVALLDPAQISKLKSIDPEPLLETVTPQEQQRFEQKQAQQLAKLEQEIQKQIRQPPKNTQVVETAKPAVEVAPDHARYVSEYNTKTDRETVARGSRKEDMVAAPKPEELKTNPNAKDPTSSKPPSDRPPGVDERAPDAPGKLSMRAPGALAPADLVQQALRRGSLAGKDLPVGSGLTPHKGQGAFDQQRRDPSEIPRGHGGAGGGVPHVPNLRPSDDQLQRVVGGGSVDHYDDVEEGDVTAVNSRQWIGASFMNRTKRQVAQEWHPAEVWRHFDPTGSVYGFKTRVTVLRVTLGPDGALQKTVVVHGSGVDFLDDEAIRAFKAAAPFPNPPDVLRGDDGLITFNFGFYFEIDAGHSTWKIFRSL